MDRITNALSSIPGYDAYRDKENRRETDRRVRDRISERLGHMAEGIESVASGLANQRDITAVGQVDAVAREVRHLQDLVRTTSYGYGGLYSDRDVDAVALEQLNQFDNDLLTRVDALGPLVDQLKGTSTPADRDAALSAITAKLGELKTRFDERSNVVETGRPSAPFVSTSPLTVLEQESTKPLMTPAFGMKKGDALSYGGTNFIVDAVIEIQGQQPMKLFRIDVGPDRWLLVNERFGADLRPATITDPGDDVVIDGESLSKHGSGSAPSTVTGLSGTSGQQTVTYRVYGGASEGGPLAITLEWPSDKLTLVGHGIALDDVEVFGKPVNR